jgi:hypothetical protein
MAHDQPNTGLRLTAEDVAQGIKAREQDDKIAYGVLDPSAFAQDGGPSIAERMIGVGVTWRRADNARVAQRGAMGGWDQLRSRLKGDDYPMLSAFFNCIHTIERYRPSSTTKQRRGYRHRGRTCGG